MVKISMQGSIGQKKNFSVFYFGIFSSLVFVVFFSFLNDCFNLPKFVVALSVVTGFLCYLAMRFLSMRTITLYKNPLYIPLALFLIWQIFCLVFAQNRISGISQIGLLFLCSTLIFIVPLVLLRYEDFFLFIRILVISSILIAVYGILQHYGIDFVRWEIKNSALSTLGRRNFAGEYLVMILPWTLFCFLTVKKSQKPFYLLTFLLLLFHLFLTFTRASWIGFCFSMILLAFVLLKFNLKPIIKITIALFVFFLAFSSYAGVFQFEQGTLKSRLLIWKSTVELIKQKPFSGHGTGNFELAYYKLASEKEGVFIPQNQRIEKAHNEFLEIAAENGIIGLGLFLLFIFMIFKIGWRILNAGSEKNSEKFASVFAIAGIFGILVNSLASFPLQTGSGCFFFFINCGILSRFYFTVSGQKPLEKKFSYPGVLFLCMASICAVIVFSFAALFSSYSLKKSKSITSFAVETTEPALWLIAEMYAKNAVSYNPFNIESYFHLGKLYLISNQLDAAYENFKKALEFQPYSEVVLVNLGIVEQRRGNYDSAEKYFLKALTINKNNLDVLRAAGNFYLELKNYDRAISYLSSAHLLAPQDIRIIKCLAGAYSATKDRLKAKEYWEKVLQIDPSSEEAKEQLQLIE